MLAGSFSFGPGPARFGSAPPLSLRTTHGRRPRGPERHRRVGHPHRRPHGPHLSRPRHPLPAGRGAGRRGRSGPRHPRPSRAGQRPRPGGARPVPGDGAPRPGTPARGRTAGGHARVVRRRRRAALRGRRPWDEKGIRVQRAGGGAARGLRHVRHRGAAGARPGPRVDAPARGDRRGGRGELPVRHRQGRAGGGGHGRGVRALAPRPRPGAERPRRPGLRRRARTGARLSRDASSGARRTAPQFVEDAQLRDARTAGPARRAPSTSTARRTSSSRRAAPTSRPADALLGAGCGAPWARARREPVGLAGAGVFEGRWRGTLDAPVFEGRFTGEDVTYLGVPLGPRGVGGRVRRARGAPAFAGPAPPGGRALGGRTRADGRPRRARTRSTRASASRTGPPPDLVKALGWDVEVQGLVSGEADAHRPAQRAARERPPRQRGRPLLRGALRGPRRPRRSPRPRHGSDRRPRPRRRRDASTSRAPSPTTASTTGAAQAEALDVGALVPATSSALRWGGRVSGSVLLQGTLARPRLEGDLRAARLFLGDEGIGALEGRITGRRRRPRGPRRALPVAARGPGRERHASAWPRPTRPTSA